MPDFNDLYEDDPDKLPSTQAMDAARRLFAELTSHPWRGNAFAPVLIEPEEDIEGVERNVLVLLHYRNARDIVATVTVDERGRYGLLLSDTITEDTLPVEATRRDMTFDHVVGILREFEFSELELAALHSRITRSLPSQVREREQRRRERRRAMR